MSDSEVKQEKEFDVFEFNEKDDLENGSDHSSTGSPIPPGTTEESTGKKKHISVCVCVFVCVCVLCGCGCVAVGVWGGK